MPWGLTGKTVCEQTSKIFGGACVSHWKHFAGQHYSFLSWLPLALVITRKIEGRGYDVQHAVTGLSLELMQVTLAKDMVVAGRLGGLWM